jgi:hypothetical protein
VHDDRETTMKRAGRHLAGALLATPLRLAASPEQFGAFLRSDVPKWAEVVRTSGAKGE